MASPCETPDPAHQKINNLFPAASRSKRTLMSPGAQSASAHPHRPAYWYFISSVAYAARNASAPSQPNAGHPPIISLQHGGRWTHLKRVHDVRPALRRSAA
jgi:hypothetical protein